MRIDNLMSDDAVIAELGQRLAALRLARQITQAQLADAAGISKRTVERIEGGASTQLTNVIRYLRGLGAVGLLEGLLPPLTANPIDLLEGRGKRRQRARPSATEEPAAAWVWGEDK